MRLNAVFDNQPAALQQAFVAEYEDKLSGLSRREALKAIKREGL